MGKDVTETVFNVLNTCMFMENLNHSHITLIPKKKNPKEVTDF